MRPPEFTGGNAGYKGKDPHACVGASMRPPEFTGGNHDERGQRCAEDEASMRPPEFTGGNKPRMNRRWNGRTVLQ